MIKTLKAPTQLEVREKIGDYIEQGYKLHTEPYRPWWSDDWRAKVEAPRSQLEIRTESGGWR